MQNWEKIDVWLKRPKPSKIKVCGVFVEWTLKEMLRVVVLMIIFLVKYKG